MNKITQEQLAAVANALFKLAEKEMDRLLPPFAAKLADGALEMVRFTSMAESTLLAWSFLIDQGVIDQNGVFL